jgi:putative transposase
MNQDGVVLDILVQLSRDAKAAQRFFGRLLKGLQYVPRVIVTDKLRSCDLTQRQLLPNIEHRQSRYLNNRAENSHRPTRRHADTPTRAADATIQIARTGAGLSFRSRIHP